MTGSGIKPLGEQFSPHQNAELARRAEQEFTHQLTSNPRLDGIHIENVSIEAGENAIPHRLGRVARGWELTRIRSRSDSIYRHIYGGWIQANGAAPPANVGGDIVFADRIAGGHLRAYLSHATYPPLKAITELISYNWYLVGMPGNVTDVILQGGTQPAAMPTDPKYIDVWCYDVSAAALADLSSNYKLLLLADCKVNGLPYMPMRDTKDPDAIKLYLTSSIAMTADLWVF